MHSSEEPNSLFGGMAAPEWNSLNFYIADPANECSWLFKLEAGENKYYFLFIIIKGSTYINGNAFAGRKLLLGKKVHFLVFIF